MYEVMFLIILNLIIIFLQFAYLKMQFQCTNEYSQMRYMYSLKNLGHFIIQEIFEKKNGQV